MAQSVTETTPITTPDHQAAMAELIRRLLNPLEHVLIASGCRCHEPTITVRGLWNPFGVTISHEESCPLHQGGPDEC